MPVYSLMSRITLMRVIGASFHRLQANLPAFSMVSAPYLSDAPGYSSSTLRTSSDFAGFGAAVTGGTVVVVVVVVLVVVVVGATVVVVGSGSSALLSFLPPPSDITELMIMAIAIPMAISAMLLTVIRMLRIRSMMVFIVSLSV